METPNIVITLEEAQKRAQKWRDGSVQGNDFKGSLISKETLVGLMGEDGQNGIRAYNGIDDQGEYKLLLVAVDSKGNDLIDENGGFYIYDFTTPCPTGCDINSPLYTL